MTPRRRANQTARCLIGKAEGFSLTAYKDAGGVWTIGWGTTKINGRPVSSGMKITWEEAVACFNKDMERVELEVSKSVRVPLTENQFSSIVSLVYNIGGTNFRTSTLLRKLNKGDYDGAANEFRRWVYAKRMVLGGLVARRERERELFLTPDGFN